MSDLTAILLSPINIVIGFVSVIALIFILKYLKVKSSLTKPVSREDIERANFIKRMEINKNQSHLKYLYRGKDLIGEITHSRRFVISGNPHNYLIEEMVVKPSIKLPFIRIPNILGKSQPFQINLGRFDENSVKQNVTEDKDKLVLPSWVSFNYYFGIYYDITIAREHQDIILQKDLSLTDLHNEKSVDFAKAQELATIGYVPYAHEMGMKEKDIQHEIARKKGEQQST